MLRLCIAGACGKMGKRISELALKDPEFEVAALLESQDCPYLGESIKKIIGTGNSQVTVTAESKKACENVDCFIDFTVPAATLRHIEECLENTTPMVIGTTGFSDDDVLKLREASDRIPIVFSPNMAVGVNLVFKIVSEICGVMGSGLGVRVDETHHVHKKDSPSGTALKIASCVKDACGIQPEIEAFREGEVIGEHGIIFESEFERIELRHSAKSRDVFASGALRAAKYISERPSGLYNMPDVLGL